MKRVLITGANGSVGSNLCRHFTERGFSVYGMVRPTSDLRLLEGIELKLVVCDLSESRQPALPENLDWVVHAAALTSDVAGDGECRRHIYHATENLVTWLAASAPRLERFVYVSTALVLGYGELGISPEKPGRSADFVPYVRWKRAAEEYVLGCQRASGLPAVVLRPADVFGPGDRTSCEQFCRLASRGVPLIVGDGSRKFAFCYTGNLNLAVHRACVVEGVIGKCYTVMNAKPMTWRRFFGYLQGRLGKPQRVWVPAALVRVGAAIQEGLRCVNRSYEPRLSRYRALRATTDTSYDISATVAELGYYPDEDEDAQLESIADWYLGSCACRN